MIKGFLLVDKGKGLTSFDVVHEVRKWSNVRCVGHAGTLDPLATGLLIVAIGEATKFLEYLVGCDKEYEVLARFGVVSETYDAEGPLCAVSAEKFKEFAKISKKDLEKVIRECFLGEIDQVPPKYSALKIKGKKAADLMRKGLDVEMKSRKVKIYDFEVLNFSRPSAGWTWPEVKFSVKCGSGTYIRSLIHDLGQQIGCGAYVFELRRTMIDEYKVDGRDVVAVSRDGDFVDKNIEQYLMSIESFVEKFDSINLTDREFVDLSNGKTVLSNKVVRSVPTAALYKGKVAGIVENAIIGSGLKFRKRIH